MIGYPKFIMDPKELDKVFNDVSRADDVPWVSFFCFPHLHQDVRDVRAYDHGPRVALSPTSPPEGSRYCPWPLSGDFPESCSQSWGGQGPWDPCPDMEFRNSDSLSSRGSADVGDEEK